MLSRFVPILRTCAPFVAGIARMPYARFQAYNIAGGLGWVLSLVWAGFFFGNIPIIKDNFGAGDHRHHRGLADPGGLGGVEEVSSAYRSFAHRVDIGAPVERVWRAFTDSRAARRAGPCPEASITPREKGRLHVVFAATWSSTRTSTCWSPPSACA